MKALKMAFAIACAVASTAASAGVVEKKAATSGVSTCYYEYTVITPDGVYDVYTCYSNGNGTY
jgi:hypothetical protein